MCETRLVSECTYDGICDCIASWKPRVRNNTLCVSEPGPSNQGSTSCTPGNVDHFDRCVTGPAVTAITPNDVGT